MLLFIAQVNKLIRLNFRNCHSYKVVDEKVQSNIIHDSCCNLHEGAERKIIYHACTITDKSNFNSVYFNKGKIPYTLLQKNIEL